MKNAIKNIDPTEEKVIVATGDEYSNHIEDEIDTIRLALHEETKRYDFSTYS
ncbi:MAG: hypothetical protein LBG48_01025 [Rickettsiales bacterium]|jgi:hypothetical protein|nr:hypothetical protein [Rickettsiales bacterium]